MLRSVGSSTTTPHSFTEKALRGAQLPWVPPLLISSAQLADLRTRGSLMSVQVSVPVAWLSLYSCKHSELQSLSYQQLELDRILNYQQLELDHILSYQQLEVDHILSYQQL